MIRINPNDTSVHIQKGIALFALERLEEAIVEYDDAVERYQRTIEHLRDNNDLQEAIKLNTNLGLAYNNRGSAYFQLGRVEKSIEDYDRAIRRSPRSAEFYAIRALAYEVVNRDAEARRDFERAKEMGFNPNLLGQD
jgi:tetratricopeptide (TPR) repeat protein